MTTALKKRIFFLSVFSLSGMLQAEDFPRGFSKPQLSLGLSGFSIKEEALISRGSATFVEGRFLYGIDERLRLNLIPVASFISGQQTSRDPLSPLTNSIYLKEASLEQKLDYDISLKAGVLYQKEFLPSIAGYTKAFPGLGFKAPLIIENHSLELRAQVAVPASSGLASTSSELESSASLYSATAFFRSTWTTNFSSELSVSRFGFNKLSSSAASESIYRGNTIANVSVSTKAFVYKYAGNEVTFGTDYKNEFFVMNLKSSFIKNSSAPTNLSEGYFVSVSPGVVLPTTSILHPVFEHYHVESDAMVAAYSDTTYGRTNRDGYRYGLAFDTDRFRVNFIYAHSKLIQNNPFQSADKTYFLNINIDNL